MITVIVSFKLPDGITRDEVIAKFEQSTYKWRDNPDLIRKYYLFNIDRGIAGGVYFWKEKMHADIWLGAEFRKMVKDNYGDEPLLQFFESPIVVDNLADNVIKE